MNSLELIKFYDKDSYIQSLCSWLSDSKIKQKALKGLVGGLKYLVPSVLFSRLNNNFCFVVENKEVAFSFYYNLKKILNKKNVFLFPSLGYKYYGSEKVENSNVVLRGEVLSLIQEREREKKIIITYPEAIFERVVGKTQLSSQTLNLALGDEISYLELESKLMSFGFEQSDFIEEVGQYSIRGQVFDLYSFAYSLPFRITFNENKITKISTFDIETQLSVERKNQITILTNPSSINKNSENVSLFEYLDESFIVWVQSKKDCALKIESLYGKTKEAYAGLSSKTDIVLSSPPEKLFINKKVFNGCLDKFISVDFGVFKTKKSVDVEQTEASSESETLVSSETTETNVTTTGGNTVKSSEAITYEISDIYNESIEAGMVEILNTAGFELIDGGDLDLEEQIETLKADYGEKGKLSKAVQKSIKKNIASEEISFYIQGIFKIGSQEVDAATGLKVVNVSVVSAKMMHKKEGKKFWKTVATVAGNQRKGKGTTYDEAINNAIRLCAQSVAKQMVQKVNAKGIK